MSQRPTADEHSRASQSQLLTKIYYPDTLYPDNYSFFADRADSTTTRGNSSLPMHSPAEHYPSSSTADADPVGSPTTMTNIAAVAESEVLERQGKYPVSISGFLVCSFMALIGIVLLQLLPRLSASVSKSKNHTSLFSTLTCAVIKRRMFRVSQAGTHRSQRTKVMPAAIEKQRTHYLPSSIIFLAP